MTKAHLTLVGAGPGDPGLITLKGYRALAEADAILYDALVDPELLRHARPQTLLECVGKRAGQPSWSQEAINDRIAELASGHAHIVRLKGGDPFVFGRGYEEIEFARALGLTVTVIPGLTSATSVPALAGIPVTHREVSRSFHVITAVTKSGSLSEDVQKSVALPGTKVILMGLGKLKEIVDLFSQHYSGDLGVAILEKGSRKDQRTISGTLNTIIEQAQTEGVETPAIIIVGEVVHLLQNEAIYGR
ncbi:MAG: uroporphyrinogen-III C-methyltransferase [Saprospiraceae bacterium]|nr:uroporphyrinogen-III C-methyltransferase [Saprospiraceae bacterium]